MVWPFFETGVSRNPWAELRQMQSEADRLFHRSAPLRQAAGFPAINLWGNDETIHLTAEVAGIEASAFDLSVQGDQVTIRGRREPFQPGEDEVLHRRERSSGNFVRTITLPFAVNADSVEASYKQGVLTMTIHRAEEDKPKKIAIKSS